MKNTDKIGVFFIKIAKKYCDFIKNMANWTVRSVFSGDIQYGKYNNLEG